MDQEKKSEKELEIWREEAKKLIAEDNFVRLVKNGEEFYFDSRDLDKNLEKFLKLRRDGWEIGETISLPAYLPARKVKIENMDLAPRDWGYIKNQK